MSIWLTWMTGVMYSTHQRWVPCNGRVNSLEMFSAVQKLYLSEDFRNFKFCVLRHGYCSSRGTPDIVLFSGKLSSLRNSYLNVSQ